MTPDIFGLIETYVSIQRRLIAALKKRIGAEKDWQYLMDVPKRGAFFLDGREWQYRKHGVGVTFTREDNSSIVNAHRFLDDRSDLFDAGRLTEYLYSQRSRTILVAGIEHDVTFESMGDVLIALARAGKIHRYEGIGETYHL